MRSAALVLCVSVQIAGQGAIPARDMFAQHAVQFSLAARFGAVGVFQRLGHELFLRAEPAVVLRVALVIAVAFSV